jgi:peptidoglycan/LPS O-acetylase OafA/YrhL
MAAGEREVEVREQLEVTHDVEITEPAERQNSFEFDSETRLGYRPALDGVRALAVIPVMVGHAVSTLAPGGFSGVRLFFVLSGFLITTLLVEEWSDTNTIRMGAFYMRRALRLLPALFLLLAGYLLAVALLEGVDAVGRLTSNVVTVVFYVANWKFVAVGEGRALGHLWSLSVEEQFYLLWPLGLYLMLRFLSMKAMLTVTAVVAAGSWLVSEFLALQARGGRSPFANVDAVNSVAHRHAFYGTDAVAYALLAGCLVALLRSSGRLPVLRMERFLAAAGLVGLGLYAIQVLFNPAPAMREVVLLVLTFGFLGIILCAVDVQNSPLTRVLTIAPLRYIGRISYGLYLWHFVVLSLLRQHQPDMSVPVRTFVAGALTLGISALSFKLVEQPFLRLKRKFVVDKAAAGHPE